MAIDIKSGAAINVVFPVPSESDNYTHVAGLITSDFTISCFANGSAITLAPQVISEVTSSSGQKMYRLLSAGFPLPGKGYIEVRYPTEKIIFAEEFNITDNDIDDVYSAITGGGGGPSIGTVFVSV